MAKVFFSYSHKDRAIREKIDQHFSVLKRSTIIETWYDNEIPAGDNFDKAIKTELEEADIILLLVSANFLASDYCHDIELKLALKKHNSGEAKAVPIIVDICDWENTPLKKLKAIPTDGRAIRKFGNRSEAYQNITDEVRKLAHNINSPTRRMLKAGISNKNVKISSAATNSFKVARFIKSHSPWLSILTILTLVFVIFPRSSSEQEKSDEIALNTPLGLLAIEQDLNHDGYKDKVSFLSYQHPNQTQGLYIFMYDPQTQRYYKKLHKTNGLWNNKTPFENISLNSRENGFLVSFSHFEGANGEGYVTQEITVTFPTSDAVISRYIEKINDEVTCDIDYLSGKYSVNGQTITQPPNLVTVQAWNTGHSPFECYL